MSRPATAPASAHRELVALLGGQKALRARPRTEGDLIALVRRGLPFSAFRSAAVALDLSLRDIENALGLSARSLQRRRAGRLNAVESERVMRLVRVAARAEQVLGDRAAALDWLTTPNRALAGEKPLGLLDTDLGADRVLQLLGRIEFGVYT